VVAGLLVTAVLAAGCSNGDDDDEDEDASPPNTATTIDRTQTETSGSPDEAEEAEGEGEQVGTSGEEQVSESASPEDEVEAAYGNYWMLREHAMKFPGSEEGDLEDVASGDALERLNATVADLEDLGQQGQFGPLDSHHVYEVVIDGETEATVSDCAVSDAQVVVAETGEEVRTDPPDGSAYVYTATMLRDDGVWKVDHLTRSPLSAEQSCTADGPVTGHPS
jgi:hypothetical protein